MFNVGSFVTKIQHFWHHILQSQGEHFFLSCNMGKYFWKVSRNSDLEFMNVQPHNSMKSVT